jgi:hypothetical protein
MELFKRLRAHGIGERLAFSWMIEEPDLAAKAVDYTEDMDGKGLIKGKTAGYIRRLIETRADFGESQYERNKIEKLTEQTKQTALQKQQENKKKRLAEYQKILYQQALKSLSPEQLHELKDKFLLSDKGKNISQAEFDYVKGKFFNQLSQLTFLPWLIKEITPKYSNDDFVEWLKEKV